MGVGTGVATGARAPPNFWAGISYLQFRMRSNPTGLQIINSRTHKFYCHHIMGPPNQKHLPTPLILIDTILEEWMWGFYPSPEVFYVACKPPKQCVTTSESMWVLRISKSCRDIKYYAFVPNIYIGLIMACVLRAMSPWLALGLLIAT